jgi:NADH-ubiquinone oxidoreductase ASHI subunit (CI-ASHI or NDUFB8)
MRKSLEESGLPGSFVNKPFEKDSMIGDYPRLLNQWSILKNPRTYWDKQGRRKYGEILHDFDNFTDVVGIGAEQSPAHGLKLLAQALGFITVVCTAFYIWDPPSHAIVGAR